MNEEIQNEENLTQNEQEKKEENLENLEMNFDNLQQDDALSKLQNELNEITDKFYRANADFENIKKRMEKDREVAVDYANEKFAKELLNVIDALEEAAKIDVEGNELAINIKDGVKNCIEIFKKTFEKFGITQIDTSGEFDANFHNAISVIQNEEKSGQIVQVYQKGYLYKGRVLRASMVVIAK